MKSLFRRHFSIIPLALLLTGCPALRHSSIPTIPQVWAPGDESADRLNKFAEEYNLYVSRLHQGYPRDLVLWKKIEKDWELLHPSK